MSFRNVRSARKFLGQLLEHSPPDIDTREYRVDLLNTAYMNVNDKADWLFLLTEQDWKVWQDRSGEDLGITVSVTNGLYLIVFSSTLGTEYGLAAQGMTFEDENGDTYTINRSASGTIFYLDKAYTGATNAAMTTWKIKTDRFYLPVDCSRPRAFINRSNAQFRGPISIVDRRTEENTVSWWGENEGIVFWVVDNDNIYDEPPQPLWRAVESTAAGSLLSDADYEVCYTTTKQGRESPPSNPIRVKMSTAANHQIQVTLLDNTSDGGVQTGIWKNLYIRQLTSSQDLPGGDIYTRWYMAQESISDTTTSATISAFPSNNAKQLVYQNGRKYMKTVWKPGGDYTFRVSYLVKPNRLVADTDAPHSWPEAYHDLIVYGAAVNLGLSQGASTAKTDRYQKLYNDLLREMEANQLMVPNMTTRKQMRSDGSGPANTVYYTRGNATTDYSGNP